ncbi:MAG: hypothetical protein J5750_01490 [Clostridiales bacterium]|nr:hypothetical protein [Clostridiales bacterium]
MGTRRWFVMVLIILIFVAATITVFVRVFDPSVDPEKDQEKAEEYVAKYVEDFNAKKLDVMFYRVDPSTVAPESLKARRIDNMVEAESAKMGSAGRMIVICDLGNGTFMEDDEFAVVKKLLEQKNVYFIYLGNYKYGVLKEAGIIDNSPSEDTMSYLVYHSSTKRGEQKNIAKESLLLPINLRSSLSETQNAVYSFILEMSTRELYWN